MRLRALHYDELVAQGVNPLFARILTDPASYHPDLAFHVGKTDWDYFIPEGVTNVVPLWDSNADSFVRWNRDAVTEYVWLFHDDPNWALIAHSEQGIMSKLWESWAEFQESDDECHRFADAIGFRYCDKGLAIWDEASETIDRWRLGLED